MAFISILDREEVENREVSEPSFFQDLNLDQILKRILMVWGQKVQNLYYYFPADKETEKYRRDVYSDIKNNNLFEPLKQFVETMSLYKKAQDTEERISVNIQKKIWHLQAAVHYCDAFIELNKVLKAANTKSQGFKELIEYLDSYLKSDSFTKMNNTAHKVKDEMANMRISFTYDGDKIVVHDAEIEHDFENNLEELFPGHVNEFETAFSTHEYFSALELELYVILKELKPEFFRTIEDFASTYKDFSDKVLNRFHVEIPFYLSFYAFSMEMHNFGYDLYTPTVDENKEFAATDLYDLALACVNTNENKPVISNTFNYKKDESFFVLTGPNQGGKTTFARSLGQLVFFTKMGLDVPAANANVHFFADMLTHFSVEESVETGRGKLKEELIRLAPMMKENKSNSFVVINELFTTAANYDASIMGKKVLEHFINLKCTGIYVTHIKELSEGHPNIVSLRAMLDENNIQSFKIKRSAANDDACAINQINKYKLGYEQLKERLSSK